MRSLLIVPPGDPDAFAEALASGADALILDIGAAAPADGPALYLRLPPLDDAGALEALKAAVALKPRGVALPLASGADLQRLGSRLAVEEARLGLAEGSIRVLAFAAESAAAVLALPSYRGASARLEALISSATPLAASLRADPARRGTGPLRLARDLTLIAARAAGVLAIDAAFPDADDGEGLRADVLAARADGFDGKLALSGGQARAINEAFGLSPARR